MRNVDPRSAMALIPSGTWPAAPRRLSAHQHDPVLGTRSREAVCDDRMRSEPYSRCADTSVPRPEVSSLPYG
jgi:hypothetical protein